jgi:Fe-S cluster assembly iron-binding protein IscA
VLALTDYAVDAVKIIVSSDADTDAAGMRVTAGQAGEQPRFRLDIVSMPVESDQVIEAQGARVFLGPDEASLLDNKIVDAKIEQSRVAFTIGDQAGVAT